MSMTKSTRQIYYSRSRVTINSKMMKPILLGFLIFHFSYGEFILPTVNVLEDPLSNDFIDHINSIQNSWTAGRNFGRNTSLTYLRRLMGVKKTNSIDSEFVQISPNTDKSEKLPDNFDARNHWPNCPTIGEIRDQGSCGSCWAFAAVGAMSDRVCIHSNGAVNFHFSAQNLLSCCAFCAEDGCKGGDPVKAWFYWNTGGIASGGAYGSNSGCVPYTIPPCDNHTVYGTGSECDTTPKNTPKCIDKCIKRYKIPYIKDLHFGKSVRTIINNVEEIREEIYTNGPVEAQFIVHEDFLNYKSGVYRKVIGNSIGTHAVRILGWGIENDEPYWLAANSWNSDWGDNGFFKILRGSNECGIENIISSGLPKLDLHRDNS